MELASIFHLKNIYLQTLEVSPKQLKVIGVERLVISYYREIGYNAEKVVSSSNISSNNQKINKVLSWYIDLIDNKKLGEIGKINIRENGIPDLIVYKNQKNWFFVEVKAYNDAVQPIQLYWYRKHQQYPVCICIVLPNKNSKSVYIAKKENIPCKHTFKQESIVGYSTRYKCKKCGFLTETF